MDAHCTHPLTHRPEATLSAHIHLHIDMKIHLYTHANANAQVGGDFERTFDDLCFRLRDACHVLRTDKAGRMPLAYVHIVQLMVDSLMFYMAYALYPKVRLR